MMKLDIYSPTKILYQDEADEVVAPSVLGEVGILPQHTEYITLLKAGKLKLKKQGQPLEYDITGGLMSVARDRIKVMVDGVNE